MWIWWIRIRIRIRNTAAENILMNKLPVRGYLFWKVPSNVPNNGSRHGAGEAEAGPDGVGSALLPRGLLLDGLGGKQTLLLVVSGNLHHFLLASRRPEHKQ
jgi:hypothetical protein